MALKRLYRDSKGRFARFESGKKLRPFLKDTSNKKIWAEGQLRSRKTEPTLTGIQIKNRIGRTVTKKFGKGQTLLAVGSGSIYVKGVKVASLKSGKALGKVKLNLLERLTKELGEKETTNRQDVLELLLEIYPKSGKVLDSLAKIKEDEQKSSFSGQLPAMLKHNTVLRTRLVSERNFIYDFWTLDTEDDSRGNPKIVDFYNGEEHFSFQNENTIQLLVDTYEFLLSEKMKGAKVFCVNLQYDLNNVFGESWKTFKNAFSGNFLVFSRMVTGDNKKRISFYESLFQIPLSVEKLGQTLDLEKFKVENRVDLEYCKRDNEITWTALKRIFDFDKVNRINFGPTLGSKSLKSFQCHIKSPIIQRNFTEFLPAYRGGRNEIFKHGKIEGPINTYDINSLYPAVMHRFEFPDPESAIKTTSLVPFGVYFAEVDIKTSVKIPYLGLRLDGKFMFPVGRFRGMYTGFELLRAQELGQVNKMNIIEGFKLERQGFVFKNFISKFYQKRLDHFDDKLLNKYIKIFMNSLYGKFGQKNEVMEYDETDDLFHETFSEKFPEHSNIIWAVYVTAYARDILYNFLHSHANNVAYCDTDSVHLVKDKISETGTGLGEMKYEGTFDCGEYLQPKVYALYGEQDVYRAKGVSGRDNQKFVKEFIRSGATTFDRPVKIFEFLRHRFNIKNNPLLERRLILNAWQPVTKALKSEYSKREVLPGGNTRPITVKLW